MINESLADLSDEHEVRPTDAAEALTEAPRVTSLLFVSGRADSRPGASALGLNHPSQ